MTMTKINESINAISIKFLKLVSLERIDNNHYRMIEIVELVCTYTMGIRKTHEYWRIPIGCFRLGNR